MLPNTRPAARGILLAVGVPYMRAEASLMAASLMALPMYPTALDISRRLMFLRIHPTPDRLAV